MFCAVIVLLSACRDQLALAKGMSSAMTATEASCAYVVCSGFCISVHY